jgi:23S rRNA (adenine1618-N6)-methyltransferase
MANTHVKTAQEKTKPEVKTLHPNNEHKHGYDFTVLIESSPELAKHVIVNKHGNQTVSFSDPLAVKALNAALLKHHYHIQEWNIPDGFLCPPIPGRIDYIHYIADLLNEGDSNTTTKMLDIGTGANGIYALLAAQVYGWDCVASDIDLKAIENVAEVVLKNPSLTNKVVVRLQADKKKIFAGIIKENETYDVSVCNPPFHGSLQEALSTNQQKRDNLAANRRKKVTHKTRQDAAALNFGGKGAELWCEGGEQQFLQSMMNESVDYANQCRWFTSLVSKIENLAPAKTYLKALNARKVKVIEMKQGNKITRILAWTFV